MEMSFNDEFQIPDSSGVCVNSYVKVQHEKNGNIVTHQNILTHFFRLFPADVVRTEATS